MAQNKAQNSITITRLRTGETLNIMLTSDHPLYQCIDPNNPNTINPNWGEGVKRPTVTPLVITSAGVTAEIDDPTWYWNGNRIDFSDANCKFTYNAGNKSLTIVKNLAAADNTYNDTLTFKAKAIVNGVPHNIEKSIEVVIQQQGAQGYYAEIMASPSFTLTSDNPINLKGILLMGGIQQTDYTVDWYYGNETTARATTTGDTARSISRDDVDGSLLVCAKFKVGGKEVATSYAQVNDSKDEYQVSLAITGANQQVATGSNVEVTATLNRVKDGNIEEVNNNVNWSFDIMRSNAEGVLVKMGKTLTTNPVVITTAHTDAEEGADKRIVQRDVTVWATAEMTLGS